MQSCQLRKPRTLPLGLSMSLYVAEDIDTLGTLAVPGKHGENRADGHYEKKTYCLKVQSNDISHLKNKESITIQGYVHN